MSSQKSTSRRAPLRSRLHPLTSYLSPPVWKPSTLARPESTLQPGTFVAFSISTHGTAQRFPHPSCSKARENIKALAPEIYIGMVNTSVTHHPLSEEDSRASGGQGRIEISIAPVGKCPPTAVWLKDSDIVNPELLAKKFEEFCLPLAQDEGVSVAEDIERPPLWAGAAFPWASCFLYTTANINGVVGTMHPKGSPNADLTNREGWKLDLDWLDKFDLIAMEDDLTIHDARVGSFDHPRQTPLHKPCGSRECACWSQTDCKETGMEIANDQLVLDLWLDLKVVPDVRDPHEFHQEWMRLNQIVSTCYWQDPRNMDDDLPSRNVLERMASAWSELSQVARLSISGLSISMVGGLVLKFT